MKKLINGFGGAIITLLLVAGFSLAAGSTAQAQYRHDRDNDRNRHERDRDWHRDRDRNSNSNVYDRNRNGVDDRYERNSGYGTYGNNGRYGNYGGYNQAAMNQGYQAGLNTGASDAQRGQSYNPQRSHYYRDASSQAFLQGFTQGYDQGYRQYAGYDNGRYRRGGGNVGNILGGIFGRP
jgi:Ni/Co efflux regulator RcnB